MISAEKEFYYKSLHFLMCLYFKHAKTHVWQEKHAFFIKSINIWIEAIKFTKSYEKINNFLQATSNTVPLLSNRALYLKWSPLVQIFRLNSGLKMLLVSANTYYFRKIDWFSLPQLWQPSILYEVCSDNLGIQWLVILCMWIEPSHEPLFYTHTQDLKIIPFSIPLFLVLKTKNNGKSCLRRGGRLEDKRTGFLHSELVYQILLSLLLQWAFP